MHLLKQACFLVCAVAATTVASAASYTFSDSVTFSGNDAKVSAGLFGFGVETVKGVFDLTPAFVPATMDIMAAKVSFFLADDCDLLPEIAVVDLGNFTIGGDYLPFEVDFGWVWGPVTGSLLVALQDGILGFEVRSATGDFKVYEARLDACAVGVPDGGSSVVLLGLGLLGLAAVRRRIA